MALRLQVLDSTRRTPDWDSRNAVSIEKSGPRADRNDRISIIDRRSAEWRNMSAADPSSAKRKDKCGGGLFSAETGRGVAVLGFPA